MLDGYLKALDLGYFEVGEAFKGLADENVWKRPADGLLSVGELAGHIAYWEAVKLATDTRVQPEADPVNQDREQPEPDPANCLVSSPLIDRRFAYYPKTLASSPTEQQLAMTAEQVCSELVRVHEEAVAHFKALDPDLNSGGPGWPPNYTYRHFLQYAAFHVAYHTGQMYSARHLLGESTPDN